MGGRGCTRTYLGRKPASFAASCDAVLVVEEQEFPVHASVLACHCKTFVDLFEVHLVYGEHCAQPTDSVESESASTYDVIAEETVPPSLRPRMKLDSAASPMTLTAKNFATFLDHVYNPTEAKVESVIEAYILLQLADYFQTSVYMYQCDTFITNHVRASGGLLEKQGSPAMKIDSKNLEKFMDLANRHKLRKLMAECLPPAMHYILKDKAGAKLLARMDPVIIEVLVSKVVDSSSVTRSTSCGYCCHPFGAMSGVATSLTTNLPLLDSQTSPGCRCGSKSSSQAKEPPATGFKRILESKKWGY
ncbi:hypothetical protein N2152v2_007853 [Parachlorella kessleri]